MGADCGAVDAVVAAVRHDFGERHGYGLPDPGLAPSPEPAINGVPAAVFGRDVPPRSSATEPPEYAVDNGTVLFRASATPTVRCLNGQQILQNTPFCFCQIASAQARLQKAALNQPSSASSTNLSTPPRAGGHEVVTSWCRFFLQGEENRFGTCQAKVELLIESSRLD